MRTTIFYFLLILPFICFGQNADLSIFDNLVGKTWKADGNWKDGTEFKQEVSFKYSLKKTLVIADSKGFTNRKHTEYGLRNHGVRQVDAKLGKIKFWEFDVLGGRTEGEVLNDGKNIIYQYSYGGDMITDIWEFENDSTYIYKVGFYDLERKEWKQVFLETKFMSTSNLNVYNLAKKLTGRWTSKAWDGVLNETWWVGADGHIQQNAQYLENGKVLFESKNKIERVGEDIILFSVIKDSNPKIFKATSFSDTHIRFENSEYKNPNVVEYNFSENNFKRTISGTEGGKPTSYTFDFRKLEKENSLSTQNSGVAGGQLRNRGGNGPSFKPSAQEAGKITLKVCIDESGKVTSAERTMEGTTITSEEVIKQAEESAKKWKFKPGPIACGTMTFVIKLK